MLKNKLLEFKKKSFMDSKREFYKSVFGDGFMDMTPITNFLYPEVNSIISFIETTKKRTIDYRAMPSVVIHSEDSNEKNNQKIKEIMTNFFDEIVINLLYSYIFNLEHEITGYVSVEKNSFVENIHKLPINYGFMINNECTKFIYYCTSKDSERIYVYKGLIHDKKFIKILN